MVTGRPIVVAFSLYNVASVSSGALVGCFESEKS